MLRPTISWPVCLGVKPPSEAQDQIFVTVRQFQVCWCGVPSLMRGWVCNLRLLLVLTSTVILWSKSHGTHDHILLSEICDSSSLEVQVPVFTLYLYPIIQEQVGSGIPPGTGFPFCCLPWLVGLWWRYSNPLSCGVSSLTQKSESESELLYDWWFITSQFILVAIPLRLMTRVFFFLQLNPCGRSPYINSKSQSKLIYDWWFTANQFALASSSLRLMTRDSFFMQLNPCSHSPYVTSSLTRGWICL
jgi:hypothetical protein